MFLRELKTPLYEIQGIGERKAEKLAKLGLFSVADILTRYPKDYEDRSETVPLRDYQKQRTVCTVVRVLAHKPFMFKGEMKHKIIVEDETARAVIPCFFRGDYLAKRMPEGGEFRISGHFEKNKFGELQSTHIDIEDVCAVQEGKSKFGGILPVYYYSDSERNSLLRATVKDTLARYVSHIENELPAFLIERESLLSKPEAVKTLHFPQNKAALEAAKKTLVYEELFYLETLVGLRREKRGKREAGTEKTLKQEHAGFGPLQQRLCERLPFSLTTGQTDAALCMNADMDSAYPMARLLQGDVGSGKTLVAFLAALRAVEHKTQAALMAPTELLARQHAENAARLLEPLGVHVAFLTGNIKTAGRKELLKALAAGEVDIVVGTHALFSKDVIYKNLSLVIIDEQHRFGVTQRQTIMSKGERCDLLMMSATPIPRTLAMTIFGDMDVSVIREMPPGRKRVITHLASEENEKKVYDFVRAELAAGRQAYFVYPLIEMNEDLDLKDAESMYRRLSAEIFPRWKCALLHSKIDEDTKRAIMEEFRRGEVKILVATSVVEVGVDVPNASCMVIEHAERFGLSALHQLRGRVGRGDTQSYCFLIYSRQDVSAKYAGTRPELLSDEERTKEGRRLMVMLRESDGFAIAEEDLKFRGPGEITGTEQSGFMRLGIADPVRDLAVLERARNDAFAILDADPEFKESAHRVIGEVLRRAPPFIN